MKTNLQDMTLESMDGTLVARNEQGHLSYPMLHLDREPVPEDAQGWDRVLVFVDGKTRSTISPTIIVLFEENNFSQTLDIQTGGEWSITDVNDSLIQVDQTSGTGDVQIDITKSPTFFEVGIHSCSFTISIAGALVSETTIQVYLFIGGGDVGTSNVSPTVIHLDESNNYSQTLTIQSEEDWLIAGMNTEYIQIATGQMQGVGNAQIDIIKATSLMAPGDYTSAFAVIFPGTSGSSIIVVEIAITTPLIVRHEDTTARHGDTLTVNIVAPHYSQQTLRIISDGWQLSEVDNNLIGVTRTAGDGTTNDWQESTIISRKDDTILSASTEFYVKSGFQKVKIIVNVVPPMSGSFIDPPDGVGVPGTKDSANNPVYIYI